jgi:predicted  nucleic acid-binding Zn-ribbon protein
MKTPTFPRAEAYAKFEAEQKQRIVEFQWKVEENLREISDRQAKFEKMMEEKNEEIEKKVEAVTTTIQTDLKVTNEEAVQTHVTTDNLSETMNSSMEGMKEWR